MECSTPPGLKLLCLNNNFSLETKKNVWRRNVNSKNSLKEKFVTMELHIKQCVQNKKMTKILHLKEC